jgi:hypothetical protein
MLKTKIVKLVVAALIALTLASTPLVTGIAHADCTQPNPPACGG